MYHKEIKKDLQDLFKIWKDKLTLGTIKCKNIIEALRKYESESSGWDDSATGRAKGLFAFLSREL